MNEKEQTIIEISNLIEEIKMNLKTTKIELVEKLEDFKNNQIEKLENV